MHLKFTTIQQLPEILAHIILLIKNLNELFRTGSVQGYTRAVAVGKQKKTETTK